MKKTMLKSALIALGSALAIVSAPVVAQEAKSLDELLRYVEQGRVKEAQENRAREERFKAARYQQKEMLDEAREMLANEEKRSAALEGKFEELELILTDKQRQLKERLGTLTELFGHLTSTAGDLRSNYQNSLVSVQFPGREEFVNQLIEKMTGAEQLPSITEIEKMWHALMVEMTESGKVVRFETDVTDASGETTSQKVTRVGTFNIVNSDGMYLKFEPETNSLQVLPRQPSGPYTGWAEELANANDGIHSFGVDPTGPTGGTFLSALIDSPTLSERWHQGGVVGYIITGVGVVALIIALWRLIALSLVGSKVNAQLKSGSANDNNPLGRVLKVHEENPNMDSETLELKLSEAVLKELPNLEKSLNLLKIIAAVAPLLGLLGTVTGMIITFQAITIFGAGDPKAMAGGISGALVTTVLGLCVAIPTVLLHTVVSGRSKKIIHILEEQSTGLVAQHTEGKQGA